MKKIVLLLLFIVPNSIFCQLYTVLDSTQKTPVSYATISFGNGYGLFADGDGKFEFSKKRYPETDSLFISAVGYKHTALRTDNLPKIILLKEEIAKLQEVYLTSEKKKKYKSKKIDSEVHNDYFKCWLPSVESELAVFFKKDPIKSTKIAAVYLPIKLEFSNRSSGKAQSFSTLFKMQFYSNLGGFPGKRLFYDDIIFKITEKDKSNFELNISEHGIFIPKDGIYVSIQVLGYTDKEGKLQHTKKYHEVETRKGIVKISTTFRPLLPFTKKIEGNNTFTRRVFFKDKTWQRLDKEYSENNVLILSDHKNYGMGLKLHLYED